MLRHAEFVALGTSHAPSTLVFLLLPIKVFFPVHLETELFVMGSMVGEPVGSDVGTAVGLTEGRNEGDCDGDRVGVKEGKESRMVADW